mmetsp:Transcript_64909/g.120802  ORF Transcript_64909/g.120802 Transcript_64909/m.120802 type:complete len:127 (+) Transcript_64909:1301-1681(+)
MLPSIEICVGEVLALLRGASGELSLLLAALTSLDGGSGRLACTDSCTGANELWLFTGVTDLFGKLKRGTAEAPPGKAAEAVKGGGNLVAGGVGVRGTDNCVGVLQPAGLVVGNTSMDCEARSILHH